MTISTANERLLRVALIANVGFSATCGLIAMLFAADVSALAGIPDSPLLIAQGAGLIGFSLFIGAVVMRERISARLVRAIIALDWLWIGAVALPVLVLLDLTGPGSLLMLFLAAVVALLATLQTRGLHRVPEFRLAGEHP